MRGPVSLLTRRWDLPVDPRPLAVSRIGVGVAALMTFVEQYFRLTSIADGELAMPGVTGLPPVTVLTASVFGLVGVVASVALALGCAARPAAASVTACAWLGFAWEQQTYSNHLMFIAWLALWLAVAPCDACWSLPARRRGRRSVTWGDQVLLMCQLSVCYAFAGLVKLNPGFLSGDALRTYAGGHVDLPGPVWTLAAVGAVLTELGVAVALWSAATRWAAVSSGLVLHAAIIATMSYDAYALVAFAVACLAQYPLFLNRPIPGRVSSESPDTERAPDRQAVPA